MALDKLGKIVKELKRIREESTVIPSEEEDDKFLASLDLDKLDEKEKLEFILSLGLIIVRYVDMLKRQKYLFCTSNTPLIKTFNETKKKEKVKASQLKNKGIHCMKPKKVLTWDLVDNCLKTISLNNYKIVFKLLIRPEKTNVLLIDSLLTELLK